MSLNTKQIRDLLKVVAKLNNEAEGYEKKATELRQKAKNVQGTIDILTSEDFPAQSTFHLNEVASETQKPKTRGPRMAEKTLGLIRFVNNQKEASLQQIREYLQAFGPIKDDSLRSQLSTYSKDGVFDKPRKGVYMLGPKGLEIIENYNKNLGVFS
jgi:hypothetical protein